MPAKDPLSRVANANQPVPFRISVKWQSLTAQLKPAPVVLHSDRRDDDRALDLYEPETPKTARWAMVVPKMDRGTSRT